MRGGKRKQHSDAVSVCSSSWRKLRVSAAAFWCGGQVQWRAGAVSVCCKQCCGERMRHAGAARVRAPSGCCIRVQQLRQAGAAAFGCGERVLRASAEASWWHPGAASAFLGLHVPGSWGKGWVLTIGKRPKGCMEIHHFLDECMIWRNNTD